MVYRGMLESRKDNSPEITYQQKEGADWFTKHSTPFFAIFGGICFLVIVICGYCLWRGPQRSFFPCCGRKRSDDGTGEKGDIPDVHFRLKTPTSPSSSTFKKPISMKDSPVTPKTSSPLTRHSTVPVSATSTTETLPVYPTTPSSASPSSSSTTTSSPPGTPTKRSKGKLTKKSPLAGNGKRAHTPSSSTSSLPSYRGHQPSDSTSSSSSGAGSGSTTANSHAHSRSLSGGGKGACSTATMGSLDFYTPRQRYDGQYANLPGTSSNHTVIPERTTSASRHASQLTTSSFGHTPSDVLSPSQSIFVPAVAPGPQPGMYGGPIQAQSEYTPYGQYPPQSQYGPPMSLYDPGYEYLAQSPSGILQQQHQINPQPNYTNFHIPQRTSSQDIRGVSGAYRPRLSIITDNESSPPIPAGSIQMPQPAAMKRSSRKSMMPSHRMSMAPSRVGRASTHSSVSQYSTASYMPAASIVAVPAPFEGGADGPNAVVAPRVHFDIGRAV